MQLHMHKFKCSHADTYNNNVDLIMYIAPIPVNCSLAHLRTDLNKKLRKCVNQI